MTRRALLRLPAAVALAPLAGCTPAARVGKSGGPPTPTGSAANRAAAARAVAAEVALIDAYDAAFARHPTLRSRLGPLRAHHVAHLGALSAGRSGSPAPPSPPSPTAPTGPASPTAPTSSASPSPASPTPAAARTTARAAVSRLVAAERAAAAARARDCVGASGPLAALLGSVGASEAQHVVLLAAQLP